MADRNLERFVTDVGRTLAARDWDGYGQLFAEDLIMQAPGLPGPTRGREARVAMIRAFFEAFPDGRVELQRMFGEGDWGCVEAYFEGTNTGPLTGPGGRQMPPTNRRARLPYCMVVRFDGSLVGELSEYFDQVGLLAQLGLME